jgi:hypothetical protein
MHGTQLQFATGTSSAAEAWPRPLGARASGAHGKLVGVIAKPSQGNKPSELGSSGSTVSTCPSTGFMVFLPILLSSFYERLDWQGVKS